jgi:hypothetical protein
MGLPLDYLYPCTFWKESENNTLDDVLCCFLRPHLFCHAATITLSHLLSGGKQHTSSAGLYSIAACFATRLPPSPCLTCFLPCSAADWPWRQQGSCAGSRAAGAPVDPPAAQTPQLQGARTDQAGAPRHRARLPRLQRPPLQRDVLRRVP